VIRWFSDGFRERRPALVDRASAVFRAGDIECYSASCALLAAADLRPHLASFRMPVTIVVGEEDHATPVAMSRRLHEGIPQSTLTILPEARHLTPIECPGQIASALLALLRRTRPASQEPV
jgi:3-oxoadipate enol-lactonase